MSYEIKTRAANGMKFVEFEGLDGKRKRISLGTRDPKLAERLGREKYVAHIKGEDETKPAAEPKVNRVFTLGMAIDRMKKDEWAPEVISSWPTIWSDCGILLDHIGDIELTDIQYDTLLAYVTEARAKGQANGTIKKRLSRIRKMMNNAATKWINPETRLPYLPYVPAFPVVGKANVRKAELSEEDERRVYEFCDQQRSTTVRGQDWWLFKQFIMWQIDTGMRKGETLSKTLDDVEGDIVRLYDGETKNDEGREVPLTARLQKMVTTFRAMELTGPMFSGLTAGKVFEMWSAVRSALDLGDVTIHDLRHTRGQRLADSGVPLEVIADLLGHKDVSITAHVYTVRKTDTLRKWTQHAEQEGTKLRAVS